MTGHRRRLLGRMLAAAVLGAFMVRPASACRITVPPLRLTDVLLPQALESPVVAKVRIVDVEMRLQPRSMDLNDRALLPFIARALVLEAIKGTTTGAIVAVHVARGPCGGGLESSQPGQEGFIAGEFRARFDVGASGDVVFLHLGRMCSAFFGNQSCGRPR